MFWAYTVTDAEIVQLMDELPDKVADALAKWKTAILDKEVTSARLYLQFKAKAADEKMSIETLKAMVRDDGQYYRSGLDEVLAESEYIRLNEKLMVAKKQAAMRASF